MNFQKRTFNQMSVSDSFNRSGTLLKINANELASRFRSKSDIYSYLTEACNLFYIASFVLIVQLYLPPITSVNKDFLKGILRNDKKVFSMNEVKMIKVPKYEELCVKDLFPEVMKDEKIKQYLPSILDKTRPIDRQFFFNILNTLQPDYIQEIIRKSHETRHKAGSLEESKDYILIDEGWYDKLTSLPFVSSKTLALIIIEKQGKTLHLLKESSRKIHLKRPRQKKTMTLNLKRFKGNDGEMIPVQNPNLTQTFDQMMFQNSIDYEDASSSQQTQVFKI